MKRGALVFAWCRIMLWSSRIMLRGILGTVALFAVVLIGCDNAGDSGETLASGSAATTTNSDDTVRIGTLFPHSGDLAWAGPQFHAAVSLAFELANESGGVNDQRLEAVLGDTGTNEQLATDAASGLVNLHDVPVIIGAASSGVTVAVAESVTIPAGVLLLSPASASNAITALNDDDLVFRTVVSDRVQGEVAARLARALGWERVATTYINNSFGTSLSTSFTEHFEALGGTISDEVSHELGQASHASELRSASDGDAEALITIAYTDSSYTLLREAVEGGYFEEFMFFSASYNQDLFDDLGPEYFEGNYGVRPGAPLTPARRWFFDEFERRQLGDVDTPLLSESFDAGMLTALAIEKADSDETDAIREALREVANPPGESVGPADIPRALELIREGIDVNYVGASGELDFDENGDVNGTMEIWRIEDGKVGSTNLFVSPGEPINLNVNE